VLATESDTTQAMVAASAANINLLPGIAAQVAAIDYELVPIAAGIQAIDAQLAPLSGIAQGVVDANAKLDNLEDCCVALQGEIASISTNLLKCR
jgi:hypothetical protein